MKKYIKRITIIIAQLFNRITSYDITIGCRRVGLKLFYLMITPFITSVTLGQESYEMLNSKRNLLFINHAVESRYRPEFNDRVVAKHPSIDLDQYPLIAYKVDTTKIGFVLTGETIPNIILDMPLKLINDPDGNTVTTLRKLSDKEFLVLDFWASWCKPCLESMINWESINEGIRSGIRVVGVHLDFDYRAIVEVKNRAWKLPQIIGPEGYLLNYYLLSRTYLGPSVWIKDGKLFGISKANSKSNDYIYNLINKSISELPENIQFNTN